MPTLLKKLPICLWQTVKWCNFETYKKNNIAEIKKVCVIKLFQNLE